MFFYFILCVFCHSSSWFFDFLLSRRLFFFSFFFDIDFSNSRVNRRDSMTSDDVNENDDENFDDDVDVNSSISSMRRCDSNVLMQRWRRFFLMITMRRFLTATKRRRFFTRCFLSYRFINFMKLRSACSEYQTLFWKSYFFHLIK